MATGTDPLQRDRVLIQARDTGDRFQGPSSNAALALAASLKDLEPTLDASLQAYAQKEAEQKRAEGRRAALISQGETLADAVREGKLKPTQNPWFMEAYAKESAALRSQDALSKLQVDSTTWAEKNDPAAFSKRWNEGVAGVAQGFTGKDEMAGFAPVEAQFSQQVLQSNISENQARIVTERRQNVSSLAAQALVGAASKNGGQLSAEQALQALAPSKEMWLATGGSTQDWNALQGAAITTAAYGSQNAGLLDLMKGIGVDGNPVLDGPFGNGPQPAPATPTQLAPAPVLASHALPEQFRLPVPANLARVVKGGEFGAKRPGEGPHNGLDLAVPEGTPVTSPGVGKVLEVAHDARSGNFVKVDYGTGVVSSFAHLKASSVKVGDRVAQGAILGTAGSTGHSTGPHVHWVVRVNGQAVNPKSVKFPQGAVAEAAQAVAPPAPIAAVDPSAPPPPPTPAVARGPSLYDIAGVADAAESDRYRITQAQEDAMTSQLKMHKAAVEVRAQAAVSDLYATHGTAILLGDYKLPDIVAELSQRNYQPEEIQEALRTLSTATSASAEVAANRMRINDADPTQAKAHMALALEGERDGYTPAYEDKVGMAVVRGAISGDEGTRMVSNALSTSRQKEAEARADKRAATTAANKDPAIINNYTKLHQHGTDLEGLAKSVFYKVRGRQPSSMDTQTIHNLVTGALGAWLVAHPGDFDGAYQAARDAVAEYGSRLAAKHPPKAASSSNPRAH
jgi:murein DD-endopeptidase MepM/ murein hydrolase activator NlpD